MARLDLKFLTKAAFAGPAIPLSMLLLPLTIFIGPFFALDMGLGFGVVGALFLVVRSLDALLDVLVGQWSDRTRIAFGRRKVWIACGTPVLLAATYALCFPPVRISPAYFAAAIFALYASWTLVQIPHLSWGQDLGKDGPGRSVMSAWREGATMVGTLAALLAPLLVKTAPSESQAGHAIHVLGAAVMVAIPLTVLPALAFVPDGASSAKSRPLRLMDSFGLLLNQRFLLTIGVVFTLYLALGIYNSVTLILVENELSLHGDFLWLVLFEYIVALASVPLVLACMKRFGGRDTIRGSLAALIAGLGMFAMSPPHALLAAAAGFFFIGLGISAVFIVLPVMVSNIASDHALLSGIDRLAEHLAIFNLSMKLSIAVGMGLGFLALQWLGYVPQKSAGGMSILSPPRLVGCLIPVATCCSAWRWRPAWAHGRRTTGRCNPKSVLARDDRNTR